MSRMMTRSMTRGMCKTGSKSGSDNKGKSCSDSNKEEFVKLVNEHFVEFFARGNRYKSNSRKHNRLDAGRNIRFAGMILEFANNNLESYLKEEPLRWLPIARLIRERALEYKNEFNPVMAGSMGQIYSYVPNILADEFKEILSRTLNKFN